MKFLENKKTSTENCLPHTKTRDHPVYRKKLSIFIWSREKWWDIYYCPNCVKENLEIY